MTSREHQPAGASPPRAKTSPKTLPKASPKTEPQAPQPPAGPCAWATLVMIGDAYVPGALALAQSLRATLTLHDLVCMVTPDVTPAARARLALVYDHVPEVPYIQHAARPLPSKKQAAYYGGWLERAFTKWNCLALTQYARVAFVDSDIVFVANADDLFELRPPAACFSLPWAKPFAKQGGMPNPYLPRGAKDLAHGATVPAKLVMATLHEPTFVSNGFLLVLEPSAERRAALDALLARDEVYAAGYRSTAGADEMSIAELYAGAGVDWTHIHQRYAAIPWKTEWVSRDIRGYHYLGRKPWDQAPGEWPDLEHWWGVADALVAAHPELRSAFYPEADYSRLDAEEAEWRITEDVRARLTAAFKPLGTAEAETRANRVARRWLAALAKEPRPSGTHPAAWASVYRPTEASAPASAELFEACFKIGLKQGVAAVSLANDLRALVNGRLVRGPRASGRAPALAGGTLSYGAHFQCEAKAFTAQLVEAHGLEAVACAAMRAATLLVPQVRSELTSYDYFLNAYLGITHEAFATPFTARWAHNDPVHNAFCGEGDWNDCGMPFGWIGPFDSAGRFFHEVSWVVRPPLERLEAVVDQVLAWMRPDAEQLVVLELPADTAEKWPQLLAKLTQHPFWDALDMRESVHPHPYPPSETGHARFLVIALRTSPGGLTPVYKPCGS